MAQLDMPAMVFTVIALLFYLQERYALAAVACVALVLTKETEVILPLLFAADLARRRRSRRRRCSCRHSSRWACGCCICVT